MKRPQQAKGLIAAADTCDLLVVIPAFNSAATLPRAIRSVMIQDCHHWNVKVVVVDDGSNDNTWLAFEESKKFWKDRKNPELVGIRSEENQGKAHAVANALDYLDSHYVCVLDADDFLVNRFLLKHHLQILDTQRDIFASSVNTLVGFSSDEIGLVSSCWRPRRYSYLETISGLHYEHTSAYCYRRPWRKMPSFLLSHEELRGDTAFHLAIAFATRQGVYYSPLVGSVWEHSRDGGIWRSLQVQEKKDLTSKVLELMGEYASSLGLNSEREILSSRSVTALGQSTPIARDSPKLVLEELSELMSRVYSNSLSPGLWISPHHTREVDSICEAIGTWISSDSLLTGSEKKARNLQRNLILVSTLSPKGGGIFSYLLKLIAEIKPKPIEMVITGSVPPDSEAIKELRKTLKILDLTSELDIKKKVASVQEKIREAAPTEIHIFPSHHDVAQISSLLAGSGPTVSLHFVYDHGSSLGLTISSIDTIVLQNLSQEIPLDGLRSGKEPEIRLFAKADRRNAGLQADFRLPDKWNSASAAVRAYKLESGLEEFVSSVSMLLSVSNGFHFHYGPIPSELERLIRERLTALGIDPKRFKTLGFIDEFRDDLVRRGVKVLMGSRIASYGIEAVCRTMGIAVLTRQQDNLLFTPRSVDDTYDLTLTSSSQESLSSLLTGLADSSRVTLVHEQLKAGRSLDELGARRREKHHLAMPSLLESPFALGLREAQFQSNVLRTLADEFGFPAADGESPKESFARRFRNFLRKTHPGRGRSGN